MDFTNSNNNFYQTNMLKIIKIQNNNKKINYADVYKLYNKVE